MALSKDERRVLEALAEQLSAEAPLLARSLTDDGVEHRGWWHRLAHFVRSRRGPRGGDAKR